MIFSANDQTEVERLTADPIILDDVGARSEILLMKQLWMKGVELIVAAEMGLISLPEGTYS